MLRTLAVISLALTLGACQTMSYPMPTIPPGATADVENRILCREPPSSPWYVPCNYRYD